MALIISASIDLSKIDKSKIVEGKTGGKFYNISIVVKDQKDKYGNDASISTGQTKEEREAKQNKTFIGNGKVVWSGESKQQVPTERSTVSSNYSSDDLPF